MWQVRRGGGGGAELLGGAGGGRQRTSVVHGGCRGTCNRGSMGSAGSQLWHHVLRAWDGVGLVKGVEPPMQITAAHRACQ